MREFFITQMDYIFFCYGLAFILMAVTVYFISRTRPAQYFWKWIALFGLVHGITEWLDMLALGLGDSVPFKIVRIAFLTASFLCFVEVVRLDARKRWGKLSGLWVYVPLLFVTLGAGWILGGLTGVHILSRYIFGVIGGLLAVRVIVTSPASQDKEGKDRTLSVFAWLLGCYVTTQFFAPKGTFLPASIINQDVFFSFLGFPVQLLRMVLATVLAGLAWMEYSREMLKRFPKEETTNKFRKDLWFPAGLMIILLAGWIMVEVAGRDREVEERNDQLNIIKITAKMIDPEGIKALSGTPADLQNEDYKRIQEQFLNIAKDERDVICMYLIGQRSGKNVFLFDLDQKSALGEDVHEGDVKLLNRMFLSGGAVTVGPKTNKWGTFVSSLIAISDQADGKIIAVLGFDYVAKIWRQRIARYRLGAILIMFLFTILFIVFFAIFKREQEVRRNVQAIGESLRKTQKQFREIFEEAPLGIAVIDSLTGHIYEVNPQFAKIAGRTQAEMIILDWMSITHPDDVQKDLDNMALLNTGKIPGFTMQKRYRRPEGSYVWINMTISPMTTGDKSHPRHLCMIEDITERRWMEEEKTRLLTIIEESKDFIGIADPHGNLLYHNRAAKKMVGLPEDADLSHMKIRDMHPGWAAKIVEEEGIPTILREGSWKGENALLHRNGSEIPVSQLLLLHRDPLSGKPAFISTIMRDITESKRLTEMLEKSRENLELQVMERTAELVRSFQKLQSVGEDLERASKAKSEFLANMSHELRTPLNSIIGFSEVLHDERFGPLNERQKRYTENVMVSGRHLLALINEVLDLSKVEAGKMTLETFSFPIRDCVKEVLQLLESQALSKKIKPVLEVPEDLGEIRGDRRKIQQIMSNLLSNAIKFTSPGGKIGIRGRRIDNGIEVTVWDTGVGISPENLERAFGAFERLGSPYTQETEGTGLGLTISRKMVELHGGKIWIESGGVGKGTAVKFTIPSGG